MAHRNGMTQENALDSFLERIFYAKELTSFLNEFLVRQEDIDSRQAPQAAPLEREDVLRAIQDIWETKGAILHPADLRMALVQKFMPDIDPALLHVYETVERSRYAPDRMTNYLQKPHLGLISALAHSYAITHKDDPIAMIEIDFSNMGGTNTHYQNILGLLNEQESFPYTDGAAKIIAQAILDQLNRNLTEDARILPVRAGGDELRIIATGLRPEEYHAASRDIHETIEREMAALDLHDHDHGKDKKDPNRKGFGAAIAIMDMQHIDPATVVHTADRTIKDRKNEIGMARRGLMDDAPLRGYLTALFEQNPSRIPNGKTQQETIDWIVAANTAFIKEEQKEVFLDLKKKAPPAQETLRVITQIIDSYGLEERDVLGYSGTIQEWERTEGHDSCPLFSTPAAHRLAHIRQDMAARNIKPADSYQAAYLIHLVESTTPRDPSADTWMPNDLPETLALWIKDAHSEAVKTILHDSGHNGEDPCTPFLLGVAFHNLAGLNETLGHDGANAVLRHFAHEVIASSFAEVMDTKTPQAAYEIAHLGGATFQILVRPLGGTADGRPRVIAPEDMNAIEEKIIEKTHALNATKISGFFERHGNNVRLPDSCASLCFSDIPDGKPERGMHGIAAVTHVSPADITLTTERTGLRFFTHRQSLDSKVESWRNTHQRQKELQDTAQTITTPPVSPQDSPHAPEERRTHIRLNTH